MWVCSRAVCSVPSVLAASNSVSFQSFSTWAPPPPPLTCRAAWPEALGRVLHASDCVFLVPLITALSPLCPEEQQGGPGAWPDAVPPGAARRRVATGPRERRRELPSRGGEGGAAGA